jgi:hypothetical protein
VQNTKRKEEGGKELEREIVKVETPDDLVNNPPHPLPSVKINS